jgi:hypothetical protein
LAKSWQKNVLLLPEDIYLCMRCGKPFPMLGCAFFLDGKTPYDIRLKWLRAALELLASKLLRVEKHTEYEQDTSFRSPGYKKDIHPPRPGSLAWDAWNRISQECPEE